MSREKRAIEDHFTPDFSYVSMLQSKGKTGPSEDLESFYEMIEGFTLVWINQLEPRGFGDAVLKAKTFIGADSFLVHVSDKCILSENSSHLKRLMESGEASKADAAFLVKQVEDPRCNGVVEGAKDSAGIVRVSRVVEKPQKPASNLTTVPVYAFHSVILKALEVTQMGVGGEIQLTDGIQRMVDWGLIVRAVEFEKGDIRLDIGSPELNWEAQSLSYKYSKPDSK